MNEDSKFAGSFHQAAPGFWVRRFLAEEEAFILAPMDGEGEEFQASIDPRSPAKARVREALLDALFGRSPAVVPVRLLVREEHSGNAIPGSRPLWVTDVIAPRHLPDKAALNILGPDGQTLSRWSEGIDQAVSHHGQLWIAQKAFEYFRGMNSEAFGRARARAAASVPLGLASGLPNDLMSTLPGGDDSFQCRYNPRIPLPMQIDGPVGDEQRVHYGIQRALVEEFAHSMVSGESALAEAEASLISAQVLLRAHPNQNPAFLRALTAETARGIGSQVLAGLMELNGARAASPEFDELSSPLPNGSFGRRPTLHDEILRELAPHPIAASADFAAKTAAYLDLGASRTARYEAEARLRVFEDQMKMAGAIKPRRPNPVVEPAASAEPEKNRPDTSAIHQAMALGSQAAAAADHVHQVMTQSEIVPWF